MLEPRPEIPREDPLVSAPQFLAVPYSLFSLGGGWSHRVLGRSSVAGLQGWVESDTWVWRQVGARPSLPPPPQGGHCQS